MKLKKLLTVISTGVIILCCSCSENSKKQEKDMSFAESPEIMVCRVIDAIASDDEAAYNNCCSGIENSYNQSFDDIYEKYAMQCREFGIDYETKRSAEDFNVYIYNDKRDTEGFVSFVVYLEDSELVKFHIKTQYDINKKGYCIEEIIPRNAGEAALQAHEMEDMIVEKLKENSSEYKEAENQGDYLKTVQLQNSFLKTAEEEILTELIYK